MKRRVFFKAAGAIGAAAFLPDKEPSWIQEFKRTGVLKFQTIVLHRPLVLEAASGNVTIHGCEFVLAEDFVGDEMILIRNSVSCVINCNLFPVHDAPEGTACIRFARGGENNAEGARQ